MLWLGAAILVASLAGCIGTIVLGVRHADTPVDEAPARTLLNMPVRHAASDGRDAAEAPGAAPERPPERRP